MNSNDYPNTGRIGRFVKILNNFSQGTNLSEILEKVEVYDSLTGGQKSLWWKNAIEKMEEKIGSECALQVMTHCGAKCCGQGQRNTAKRLMSEAGTIEAFLQKISNYDVKEGDLKYSLEDDHTIIAEHNRCFCKQVADFPTPFKNFTYCHCSVEFNRQFFTAALATPVQVELQQSIICGSQSCRFRITY